MEWIFASLATVTAALVCAVLLLARRQRVMAAQHYELLCRLDDLQSTVGAQRRQLESLKAVLSAPQTNGVHQQVRDPLGLIEQLGDAAALSGDESLKNAADAICNLPIGVAPDLFEADHKLLAISRLRKQGNSFLEIAARLNLPLGEVELLANTRS
jgi:hypothetical protein